MNSRREYCRPSQPVLILSPFKPPDLVLLWRFFPENDGGTRKRRNDEGEFHVQLGVLDNDATFRPCMNRCKYESEASLTYRQPQNCSSKRSSHLLCLAVTTGTPGLIGSSRSTLAKSSFERFWIVQYLPTFSKFHCNEIKPRSDNQKGEVERSSIAVDRTFWLSSSFGGAPTTNLLFSWERSQVRSNFLLIMK